MSTSNPPPASPPTPPSPDEYRPCPERWWSARYPDPYARRGPDERYGYRSEGYSVEFYYDAQEEWSAPWYLREAAAAAAAKGREWAERRERSPDRSGQTDAELEAPPIGPTVAPRGPVRPATEQVQKDVRAIKAERRAHRLESLLRKMTVAAASAPSPTSAASCASVSSSPPLSLSPPLSCEKLMQLDLMAKSQALARQRFISRVSAAWAESPQLAPRPVPAARAARPCPGNWLGLSDLLEALPSLPPSPPVPASPPVTTTDVVEDLDRAAAVHALDPCSSTSVALVLWRGHRMSPGLAGPVSVAPAMLAVLPRVSDVCAEGRRDEYTGGSLSARQLVRYQDAAYYRSRALFCRFLLAIARREVRDARERSRQPPRPRPYRVVVDVASGGGHGVVGPDVLQLRLVRQFVLALLQDRERRFVHLGSAESDSDLDPLWTGEDEEEAFALAVGTPLPDEDWPVVLYAGMAPAVGHVHSREERAVTETQLRLTWLYDACKFSLLLFMIFLHDISYTCGPIANNDTVVARQRVPGCVVSRVESDSAPVLLLVGTGKVEEDEETLALAADTPLPDEDWPLVLYRPSSSVPTAGVIAAEEVGAVETRPVLLLTWPYEIGMFTPFLSLSASVPLSPLSLSLYSLSFYIKR